MNNKFIAFTLSAVVFLNYTGAVLANNTQNTTEATREGKTQANWTTTKTREMVKDKIEARVENKIQKFKDSRVTLKNVKITAIGTSNLTVDNNGTSITVNILTNTDLRRKFWGKSETTEFSVGDIVNVVGKWTDDTKTAINAFTIRNESIQMRHGTFFGTVKSLTDGGFVISTIHREDQTVTLGSAKLINRREEAITASDIKVGDRVRVKGLWNNDTKTITEVREVKDFSLPPLPSKQPKMSPTPSPEPTIAP